MIELSTKKEKVSIPDFKEEIRSAGYETMERYDRTGTLIGTMYMIEKMDYGFHIYFIHEPSDSDPLAGKEGIVTEMYYDLRNKLYWIQRNKKEVKFSPRNVDCIFPYDRYKRKEVFDFLSTERNQKLYESAFTYLGAMGFEKVEMFGRFFHRLITEYNYYELLHKAGIEVNDNLTIVNKEGKSPIEILGLNKTRWKIFNKFKGAVSMYELQRFRFSHYDDKDRKFMDYLNYIKTLEEEFGIEKIKSFVNNEMDYIYKGDVYGGSALKVAKRYNLPEKHLVRYLYFDCDVSQGMDAYVAINNYKDYIRMSVEMGYERFDRYPKFLKTVHDIVMRNYKIKLSDAELVEWNAMCEKNSYYKYSYYGYKVFTPTKPEDLVREGNVLGHCVGSYVGKVRKGSSVIAFLRDADDTEKPLVTIEIVKDRIVQAKGKMNNAPTREQKDVIEKFAKKFELKVSNY